MRDKITCPTCGGWLINENVESSEDRWSCDVCGHVLEQGVHYLPKEMSEENEIPRRADMQRWSRAERMIHDALQAVEALGAHATLTEAVVLLGQARNKVADWHDQHEEPAVQWVALFEVEGGKTHPRRYAWTDRHPMTRAEALAAAPTATLPSRRSRLS